MAEFTDNEITDEALLLAGDFVVFTDSGTYAPIEVATVVTFTEEQLDDAQNNWSDQGFVNFAIEHGRPLAPGAIAGAITTPEGVTYVPWTDGYAVGFKVYRDGYRDADTQVEYIYLNPSSDSDDGQPNVFVYHGTTGEPDADKPIVFVDVFVDPTSK